MGARRPACSRGETTLKDEEDPNPHGGRRTQALDQGGLGECEWRDTCVQTRTTPGPKSHRDSHATRRRPKSQFTLTRHACGQARRLGGCRKKENRQKTRDGRRTRSPPARAGSWKDDQGHRGTGAGSASRHGGGLGRVHPPTPQGPRDSSLVFYRTGCTRRHGGRRGPPTGCALLVLLLLTRDSDRFAARWTPYSTGDLSRLATFLRLSHWQSLAITGTLTGAAEAHTPRVAGARSVSGDRSLPLCGLR